ncbi:MAG: hypothetical protein ACI9W7_001173, partial [Porticoccaceae bacterium]
VNLLWAQTFLISYHPIKEFWNLNESIAKISSINNLYLIDIDCRE